MLCPMHNIYREPSIHITRERLKRILQESFPNSPKLVDRLVSDIFKRGVHYSLSNRIALVGTNDRQNKKATRIAHSPSDDALLFSNTLHMVRVQMKHRGMTKYTKAHGDWEFIVELSGLANSFCQAFELPKEKGYKEYIRMFFLGRGGAFKLRQMKAFHETIFQRYECIIAIESDVQPEKTREAHDYYVHLVYERTGLTYTYDKYPEKYVNFVNVSRIAAEIKVPVKDYILGNFESLASFSTGIPSPEQLTTANGRERVIRWLAENRKKGSAVDFGLVDDFIKRTSKHKNHADIDYQ